MKKRYLFLLIALMLSAICKINAQTTESDDEKTIFRILSGKTLTLQNGAFKTDENKYSIEIQDEASLVLENINIDEFNAIPKLAENLNINIYENGQLYCDEKIEATVKKYIISYEDTDENGFIESGWYTIGFPFVPSNHNLAVEGEEYDFYRYDEPTAYWINYENGLNTFGDIKLANAYLYAHKDGKTIEATGIINVAASTEVALTTSYNGNLKGFNLIGNPYTHEITTDHLSGLALAEGYYTLSNHGEWTAVKDGRIAPLQGVLVKSNEGGNLTISKNTLAKRAEREDNGSLRIIVANDKYEDVAYVSFNEGIGLDKIEHRNVNVPMLYIPVDGKNYAIASMSIDVAEIPVSFVAKTMGQYTISVEADACEFDKVTLIDRFTGIETNMLMEEYSFIAKSSDNPERFIVRLVNDKQTADNSNFAYISGNELLIETEGVVQILDMMGRIRYSNKVEATNNRIDVSNFNDAAYIIRVVNEEGVRVQKVVIY